MSMDAKSIKKTRRSHNRVQLLLDVAAKLFAEKGYKETTMRNIASEIGILPGSVYYHFPSKQELLLAVYEKGVEGLIARVDAAICQKNDPWERLEAAVVAHLDTILNKGDYARVMIGVLPEKVPDLHTDLVELRNRYEQPFKELVNALPVKADVNKKMLRLMLLGSMNWTQHWFQPGQETPAEIARTFVRYLREATAKDET